MNQYTAVVAEKIGFTSEFVLQFMIRTIIAAVIDRLAADYYLEPRFWDYLSEKKDILGYLSEEVKQLGYQISNTGIADELMDMVYADIDKKEGESLEDMETE